MLAGAAGQPANERERGHLAAIAAMLGDDYERAKTLLGELLRLHPRDALALQVAHSFDYVTGDAERMNDRVAAVLPAWASDLPGYFQASPLSCRLAAILRRNRFVILRTDSSHPVTPHPASRRRSYLQLRSCGPLRQGLAPCK